MKYIIAKFETNYGPPVYRVRIRRRFLYSWIRSDSGEVLNFPTRTEAHDHMQALLAEAGMTLASPAPKAPTAV